MPNVWTHIQFGRKVADQIGFSTDLDLKPFFQLGTQGPDPFFYHNFWPWKKDKSVSAIGSAIHYRSCGAFLMDMIDYGKYPPKDNKLRAYILGFMTHHILDRNAHPYIIYRSGNEGTKHTKLETIIDTLIMKKLHGIDTWKSPIYKEIDVGEHLYVPIRDMLATLIDRHFPKEVNPLPSDYINLAYRHMIKAHRILYDPTGWKNRFLKERVSSYSHQPITDDIDYLNEKQTEWSHPTDTNEKYNDSVMTLIDRAEKEGASILSLIIELWNNDDVYTYEKLTALIGNISYDTGKDCTLTIENKYFEPIV